MENIPSQFCPEQSAFVECHFYQSGLKKKSFQVAEARPAWAPPDDWVGFRNECKLTSDDQIVEFVRFNYEGQSVGWLALYRFALDAEYGDRVNYEGIGLWFKQGLVTSPRPLLQSLRLLGEFVHSRDFESIERDTVGFLSDEFVGSYIDTLVELPAVARGWPLANSGATTTEIKALPGKTQFLDTLVGNEVLAAQFLVPTDKARSRLLLRLIGSGKGSDLGMLSEEGSISIADDLAKIIPSALQDAGEKQKNAVREISKLNDTISSLNRDKTLLNEANSLLEEKVSNLQTEVNSLESALAESDEHQRFMQLYKVVEGLGDRIDKSLSSKFAILRDRISDTRGDTQRIIERLSTEGRDLATPNTVNPLPSRQRVRATRWDRGNVMLFGMLFLLFVFIVVVFLWQVYSG